MIKKDTKFALAISISLAVAALGACNNANTDKKAATTDSTITDTKRIDSLTPQKKGAIEYKFATTEANLPAPFEVVNDIASYRADYKKDLLNPYANADYY